MKINKIGYNFQIFLPVLYVPHIAIDENGSIEIIGPLPFRLRIFDRELWRKSIFE
jgi:hypothetical protein